MENTTRIRQELLVEHVFDIGKFQFYPNIILGEFAEGVHVTKANALHQIQLAQEIYGDGRPFVYMSHRLHSYSMDPVGYGEVVSMFPNFKAFAIISTNKYRRMLANLERLFIKRPIGVFHTLEDAFKWADDVLEKERLKSKVL